MILEQDEPRAKAREGLKASCEQRESEGESKTLSVGAREALVSWLLSGLQPQNRRLSSDH